MTSNINSFLGQKKKVIFAVIALVLIVAIVIGFSYSRKTVFKRIISQMLTEYKYADNSRASDDSYMKIDTNPDNVESDSMLYNTRVEKDSLSAIKFVNEKLGFSSALYQKMLSTTALMGRQEQENEKYIVSWSYHPDKGLEVMYEKK